MIQQLTLLNISRKTKTSKAGKPYESVGILTKEVGIKKWVNGFADEINATWKKGDVVRADITQAGEYMNFKALPSDRSTQSNNVLRRENAKGEEKTEEEKWDRISWGKCKTLFLQESFKSALKADMPFDTLDHDAYEIEAEKWADMAMRKRETAEEKLDKIADSVADELLDDPQKDELDVSQIPF